MAKKVLITGASGLLGRALYKEFLKDTTWEVLGLAFSRAHGDLRKVDITSSEELTKVFDDFKPQVVIHSAAERKPDVVEKQPDATRRLNIDATRKICELAGKIGAWVLYISTDYVFDGKNPPYNEDATPNPLNKYGESKLNGELVTLEVSKENGVLRVPILYGEVHDLGESAVTVLFDKVKNTGSQCVMNDYERRYPTHCADIAVVIRQLSDQKLQDPSNIGGIYHWSGDENMTKYDMAVAMATALGISTNHIEADKNPSVGATRPYNAHVGCQRVESLGFGRRTPFKDGIVPVLSPFVGK
ncbi:methionine adenosyltransferase 2 subunit beta-like [Ylistrum balloti]|uniref:methionine adenosyltransferase 2 subunit beta-like n=1 Tax=Ylistrum balloti TaxID=509963 RepID=UPI002905E18F|nr:methionine adenosyltransferase 2 subunit beta-like [Ylistrum balloti]XP_060065837.1 methionine adenosyltransferase 2 subunit beta-like [Ylistrum balloti]